MPGDLFPDRFGAVLEKAVTCYRGEELEAWELDGVWTVQLGGYEAASHYLDLALAALLDSEEDVHQLAAKLITALMRERSVEGTVSADEPIAA